MKGFTSHRIPLTVRGSCSHPLMASPTTDPGMKKRELERAARPSSHSKPKWLTMVRLDLLPAHSHCPLSRSHKSMVVVLQVRLSPPTQTHSGDNNWSGGGKEIRQQPGKGETPRQLWAERNKMRARGKQAGFCGTGKDRSNTLSVENGKDTTPYYYYHTKNTPPRRLYAATRLRNDNPRR